ncbi:Hypothetical protein PBC10988_41390 [Planctomycetales bacterium 10988]|nr:Hypothetical protein PBC10988_41390 [Planctomycetales bacterium 10988]
MRHVTLALLMVLGMSITAQAQYYDDYGSVEEEAPAFYGEWPLGMYHPDYPQFCKTKYGGGKCLNPRGSCGKIDCGDFASHCDGISTCRKCGILGRIFFYDCKRLAYGQKGGSGCNNLRPRCDDCLSGLNLLSHSCGGCGSCNTCGVDHCGCGSVAWDGCSSCESYGCDSCGGCNSCCDDFPLIAWFKRWQNRPLGGYGAMTGPYQYRYCCHGWREGPVHWYGYTCGCYESYIVGHYDDRGPLNLGTNHKDGYVSHAPSYMGASYAHMPTDAEQDATSIYEEREEVSPPRPNAAPSAPRVQDDEDPAPSFLPMLPGGPTN